MNDEFEDLIRKRQAEAAAQRVAAADAQRQEQDRERRKRGHEQRFQLTVGSLVPNAVGRYSQKLQPTADLTFRAREGRYDIEYRRKAGGGKRAGMLSLMIDEDGIVMIRGPGIPTAPRMSLQEVNHSTLDGMVKGFLTEMMKD